jgi:tetratricopeptide (TPR) repeat protein
MKVNTALSLALLAGALAIGSAPTGAVDSDPSPPVSNDHAAGKKAIEAQDWNGAIKSLTAAAQRDSRNPDIQNLLGYAYRNAGQLDPAFKHYERALQLDPRHRGAHEYIGEAYLMADNLAKAEEHLAALKNICLRVCEERDDLMKSIERYRAGKK